MPKLGYSLSLCLILIEFFESNATQLGKKNRNHYEQIDWNPDYVERKNILKDSIGVFKGGPDSYLLTFAEVRPNKEKSLIGEEASNENLSSPIWGNKTIVRKRRRGGSTEEGTVSLENTSSSSPTGQLQAEIHASSSEAEEVVSSVLKSTETVRKGLGVCRKVVPRNFFNPPLDNMTNTVIKSLVGCVEEKLQDDLGCQDCITLHGDLQNFLSWLLYGNSGLACCTSSRKSKLPDQDKHMFLFRQESFGGAKCGGVTPGSQIPTVCQAESGSSLNIPEVTHPSKKLDSSKTFLRFVK